MTQNILKRIIGLLLFFSSTLSSLAQISTNNVEVFDNTSFEELYEIIISDADSITLKTAFEIYKEKAKKEKDTLELAQAYRLRAYDIHFSDGIKSLDTAIAIANSLFEKNTLEFDKFMALTYYTKGSILYKNYKDEKAVESLINCIDFSKKSSYHDLTIRTLAILGSIKAEFGQESEAILLQRKAMELLEINKHEIKDYNDIKLDIYSRAARCYAFNKELDSSQVFINRAKKLAFELGLGSMMPELEVLEAQLNYYRGDIGKAKKVLDSFEKEETGTSKADTHFYLGMIDGEMGNFKGKRRYFESYDSIMERFGFPLYDNATEVYQFLVKTTVKNDEKDLADQYLNRLIYYDSLLALTQKNLREITLKKLDLPMQEEERQQLGEMIKTKSKWLSWFYLICAMMLVGLAAYYVKYMTIKRRLDYVMENKINPVINSRPETSKLDKGVTAKVIENLEIWENNLGFLESNLTQYNLAKELGTNSAYLSQVINTFKNQNFSSYLKDLRITYAVNQLKANPEIVQSKSMIQIAEMFGFNSTNVFYRAFKEKFGVTPGVFFKRISP